MHYFCLPLPQRRLQYYGFAKSTQIKTVKFVFAIKIVKFEMFYLDLRLIFFCDSATE